MSRLLAYVPFVLLLVALAPVSWPTEGVGDSFYFWYAGHLVVTGASPYDQQAWAAASSFGGVAARVASNCFPAECLWIYPPATAWLFVPFALFDVGTGLLLLNVSLFIVAAGSVFLIGLWMRARSATRALTMSACVLSQPFIFDVHAGHFEGLGIIGLLLIGGGLNSRRALPVALGALLLSLKPHLYFLVAAVVLAVLLRERRWRALAMTAATLGIVTGLGLARNPDALGAIIGGFSVKAAGGLGWATTWAFAGSLFPDSTLIGYVVVFAIAGVAFWAALQSVPQVLRTDALIVGSAALSLAVAPNVHPYDLLPALPALALSLSITERLRVAPRLLFQSLVTITLAIGTWLAVGVSHVQDRVQALPGALPVLALVFLAAAAVADARMRRAPEALSAPS